MPARLAMLVLFALPSLASAWSARGHHTVSLIAYDLLSKAEQKALVELIEVHPGWAEDFNSSPKVNNKLRFQIGQTGYWPDVAREHGMRSVPLWPESVSYWRKRSSWLSQGQSTS